MADTTFTFKIVESGTGDAGAPTGKDGNPQASPQAGPRTQAREKAEVEGGGAAGVLQEAQRKSDEKRRKPKPKPEPKPPREPGPSGLGEQARLFGGAIAKRLGLGGVFAAIGTAGVPLAVATATAVAGIRTFNAIRSQQAGLADVARPFSPELQVSRARESLRTIQQRADIARRFGPQLAEAERQGGRFGAAGVEFGAQVATGPIGRNVSDAVEVASRLLEATNRAIQTISPFIPPGPATLTNKILDRLGIGKDPFADIKGSPLFQDFPHATVNLFPPGLNIAPGGRLPEGSETSEFTTDQDTILGQF